MRTLMRWVFLGALAIPVIDAITDFLTALTGVSTGIPVLDSLITGALVIFVGFYAFGDFIGAAVPKLKAELGL